MLTRVKSAVANFMGGIMAGSAGADHGSGADLPLRFPYGRPEFLGLSPDEVECSADHIARPILILSKDTRRLPWTTGYAEVINAGKSTHNEDQASCEVLFVKKKAGGSNSTPNKNSSTKRRSSLPNGEGLQLKDNSVSKFLYLVSGEIQNNIKGFPPQPEEVLHHAEGGRTLGQAARGGHGVSLSAGIPSPPGSRRRPCLGLRLEWVSAAVPLRAAAARWQERPAPAPGRRGGRCLWGARPGLAPARGSPGSVRKAALLALTCSDLQIERERTVYNISGGCTALVVVYLLGKLYVANAGDSRAIIIRNGEVIPMSSEFTPETERQRLQYLAYMQPHLLGNEFTHLEFPRRVQRKEVGKRMLYRDFNMTGWAYKTIEEDDLKFPLIYGEGKKARVMATIGVTRGLGDHDLKVHDSNIYIKPFLSSSPEVRVYDLLQYEHGPDDVLILATDGLWDVLLNEEVAEAVTNFLPNCDPDDPHRYTLAAQDLVMRARGVLKDRGWRISNDRLGSGDDISVYVIPLIHGNKQS
ncbi:protein phosphatase 1H [Passer montanus]|uniref:protein phosphatase 1H n=1 Tax=Passer montanus TaxID=9160 RepID=UPI001961775B|nr:protein phosphatase 1H [Passer montanus]